MFENLFSRKGLSLEKLRTLVEVADAGGIAAAARRERPPAGRKNLEGLMSRQLRELAEFFGTELIRRKGKGIALSGFGRELARQARLYFQMLSDLQRRSTNLPTTVSVGAGDSLLHWVVIPRIGEIQRRFGGAVVTLHDMRNREIQTRLADCALDFGLVHEDVIQRPVSGVLLGELRYALFVAKEKWSATPDLKKLLRSVPLASQGGETAFQRRLEGATRKSRIKLNVALFFETFPEGEQILRTREYAVVLPTIVRTRLPRDQFAELELPFLKGSIRRIHLAWNPTLVKMRSELERFREALLKELLGAWG